MDLNFLVFATGVRIFRASNDVGHYCFFSSIRVDPGPTNKGPTSLLALKIRIPVANTGKLRSIGQMPVELMAIIVYTFLS
jgi:hypothetical protein